ncbi:hypothetical protein TPHA_0I03240 [Tetrapisispora phaffii CBS 4417]|uniref:Uncharacterized protein n=1 Tax=Tetrapisispora phaffii (strain ATCC 24235 / CBS 4417 / NBRC 1672 / NRRL Y-8282 / UCD 70-5) TaxID=1071381 RepID=G8BY47_TETPH|nr:hypothetical protein TPHA_0I03240 [Tetrapisispora phaffii CBS 4417]CCE64825.1 hypothetical protein TPHA_0I03240 [Tetrapisispora phaffii CBS 4417]
MEEKKGILLEDLEIDLDHIPISNQDKTSINDKLSKIKIQRHGRIFDIPTDDIQIMEILKRLGVEGTLPNENARLRRERLIGIISDDLTLFKKFEGHMKELDTTNANNTLSDDDGDEEEEEEFYTVADDDLIKARKLILQYSITNSMKRIKLEKELANNFNWKNVLASKRNLKTGLKRYELTGSQVIAERPVSVVKLAPQSKLLASGSWDGAISIVDNMNLERKTHFQAAHVGKIGGIEWSNDEAYLFTGGEDCLVKVFGYEKNDLTSIDTLKGHQGRVSDVKLHPLGKYLGSSSFDNTWRLWDIEKKKEILLQEGHSKEIFSLAFHTDGSLTATAGFDSIGMIWDLRSGKNIMNLIGHAKPIYSLDWAPNGYQLATGSGDGTIKIWDLRNKESNCASIFAHKNLVTSVQYEKNNGGFVFSAGYDKLIKIHDSKTYESVATLEGHTEKILTLDTSPISNLIVSSGWDRTVKIWDNDNI